MQISFETRSQGLIDAYNYQSDRPDDYQEFLGHWATIKSHNSMRPFFLRILEGNDSPRMAAIGRVFWWSLWVDEFEERLLKHFDSLSWKNFLTSLTVIVKTSLTVIVKTYILLYFIEKLSIKPNFLLISFFSTGSPGKKHLFKTQASLRRILFGSDIL